MKGFIQDKLSEQAADAAPAYKQAIRRDHNIFLAKNNRENAYRLLQGKN